MPPTKNKIRERCRKGANPDHPNQHNYFWTDERQRWLVNLFEENLTAAEIGRRMGITKNAVIGRLHRCHMSCRERYSGPTTIERLQMLNDKMDAVIWETRKETYQKA